MKNVKAGKYLAAAAAGAMMFTGVAAQAAVLTFLPGTSTSAPGAGAPGGIGQVPFFPPVFNPVDLFNSPTPQQFDTMSWVAYNNNFSNTWNIEQLTNTTFKETFTFGLQNLILDGNLSPDYGVSGVHNATYVTMVVEVTGTYNGFNPVTDDVDNLNLNYNGGGSMTMYFHPSGLASDCGPTGACTDAQQIAVFNVTGGTARPVGNNSRTDLHWDLELLNDGTNLAFKDSNGDPLSEPLVIAFTDQQVLAAGKVDGGGGFIDIPLTSTGIGIGTIEFPSVPEPGMLGLFGLGLLGLGVAANRRKSKQIAA